MVSAGTADTSPAEEIQLAATATVIIMVFSMSPNSRRTRRMPRRALKTAKMTTTAAMSTPNPQPDLSPT